MSTSPADGPSAPDLSTLRFAAEDSEQAFERHPLPALLFDAVSRTIISANDGAAALYGWSRAELCRMRLEDIRPAEQVSVMYESLADLVRDHGSRWKRSVHRRRDGEPIEVDVLDQPMQLEGRPVWRAVMLDVTARSHAEALFRGVAEQSLTGIYVMQDDRFVYLNPRLAEMFGYDVDEVLAHPAPLELLTDDAQALIAKMSEARRRGAREPVHYTVRTRRRDGSVIVVEIHGSSLTMHGRPALLGTVLDVTARVTADATLAESERRFRAAFDQAMTGMALTAPDGRWLRVNRALCDMLGYSADELMKRTFQELTHPDDLPQNLLLRDALLAGDIPGYRMDKRYVHRNGEIVWVALNVSLVRDGDGAPLYMVAQMTDVTARQLAEAALGESEARLRQAQKMEAVGRLAGGVAHDFNNLLTVIGSNAEIGAELARDGLGAVEEFAEITAAVGRAAALTRQLLAFSRQQVLAPAPIAINEVVRDAYRMLARIIGVDVLLETQLDEQAGDVVADRGQLQQVLVNLVVNARDAMPDGGRVVIATSRDAHGMVVVSVTDTGSGMDPETQAHAFEPFFTTKPLGKGTGLGLSTVYGIAQQSGGDVSLTSAPGAGTSVVLRLPPSRAADTVGGAHADGRVAQVQGAAPSGTAILLVEDEAGVRNVVRRILERLGHHVIEARDGAEALTLWRTHHAAVRLVLTDAFMPVMGGRELADRLTSAGATMPVLFMSGYPDGDRGGEVPAGAALIRKPFSADDLRDRVAELLGG